MIFISGSVRSGKTAFAEKMVRAFLEKNNRAVYVATAQSTDEEMEERIVRHQKDREQSEIQWYTIEAQSLHVIVSQLTKQDVVLVDCVTNWVANEMFGVERHENLEEYLLQTIEALQRACKQIIFVSNELFSAGVKENKEVKAYMRLLGNIHQQIVVRSEAAFSIQYGVIKKHKGELCEIMDYHLF